MDWTMVLTALSAIGAAAAAGAAAWQAYETRKQVVESKNQAKMAKAQFLQARYDEARPVLVIISSPQAMRCNRAMNPIWTGISSLQSSTYVMLAMGLR